MDRILRWVFVRLPDGQVCLYCETEEGDGSKVAVKQVAHQYGRIDYGPEALGVEAGNLAKLLVEGHVGSLWSEDVVGWVKRNLLRYMVGDRVVLEASHFYCEVAAVAHGLAVMCYGPTPPNPEQLTPVPTDGGDQ